MICILFGFLILMFAAHFVINPISMAIIARSLGWSGEAQRYLSHVNKMGRTASPVYGRYYTDSRTQWVYRLVVLLWAVHRPAKRIEVDLHGCSAGDNNGYRCRYLLKTLDAASGYVEKQEEEERVWVQVYGKWQLVPQ